MERIGKPECKIIREKVETAMREALAELGLKVKTGNMTFDGETVSFKTTVSLESFDADKKDLGLYGYKYGLGEEDYLREFTSNGGEVYELLTIKPRSRKYPFVGRRKSDGKRFKFGRYILGQFKDAA